MTLLFHIMKVSFPNTFVLKVSQSTAGEGVMSENGIRDMGDGKKDKGGSFTNNWIWGNTEIGQIPHFTDGEAGWEIGALYPGKTEAGLGLGYSVWSCHLPGTGNPDKSNLLWPFSRTRNWSLDAELILLITPNQWSILRAGEKETKAIV